ncbi:hypothetical protein BJ912DRAFT_930588 [Pholiota molesta]|nr:hypothetical protein BJ912DRAFT_930588 [Pholiota molesta]
MFFFLALFLCLVIFPPSVENAASIRVPSRRTTNCRAVSEMIVDADKVHVQAVCSSDSKTPALKFGIALQDKPDNAFSTDAAVRSGRREASRTQRPSRGGQSGSPSAQRRDAKIADADADADAEGVGAGAEVYHLPWLRVVADSAGSDSAIARLNSNYTPGLGFGNNAILSMQVQYPSSFLLKPNTPGLEGAGADAQAACSGRRTEARRASSASAYIHTYLIPTTTSASAQEWRYPSFHPTNPTQIKYNAGATGCNPRPPSRNQIPNTQYKPISSMKRAQFKPGGGAAGPSRSIIIPHTMQGVGAFFWSQSLKLVSGHCKETWIRKLGDRARLDSQSVYLEYMRRNIAIASFVLRVEGMDVGIGVTRGRLRDGDIPARDAREMCNVQRPVFYPVTFMSWSGLTHSRPGRPSAEDQRDDGEEKRRYYYMASQGHPRIEASQHRGVAITDPSFAIIDYGVYLRARGVGVAAGGGGGGRVGAIAAGGRGGAGAHRAVVRRTVGGLGGRTSGRGGEGAGLGKKEPSGDGRAIRGWVCA